MSDFERNGWFGPDYKSDQEPPNAGVGCVILALVIAAIMVAIFVK